MDLNASGDKADEVIDDFAKRFNKPETWEGFTKLMHAQTPEDVLQFVKEIQVYPKPVIPGKAPSGKSAQKKAANNNNNNKGNNANKGGKGAKK